MWKKGIRFWDRQEFLQWC